MKKICVIISLFLISLSLASCNGVEKFDFNIINTKDIVLGNEVESVEVSTASGEKTTFTTTANFYEIYDEVSFAFKAGKKYSINAEMKIHDQNKAYLNTNMYKFSEGEFYEFRVKKEGSNDVAMVEEYSYTLENPETNSFEIRQFGRYIYKLEKAFCGSERGANGNVIYKSNKIPTTPLVETELAEMQVSSHNLRSLLISTNFMSKFETVDNGEATINYNDHVTREYKLYENYIVFKQSAPFLDKPFSVGHDFEIFYSAAIKSGYTVTQEAYYNVKTGEIELIKLYGQVLSHLPANLRLKLDLNIQIYVHDLNEDEMNQKVNTLISYVKSNAD